MKIIILLSLSMLANVKHCDDQAISKSHDNRYRQRNKEKINKIKKHVTVFNTLKELRVSPFRIIDFIIFRQDNYVLLFSLQSKVLKGL